MCREPRYFVSLCEREETLSKAELCVECNERLNPGDVGCSSHNWRFNKDEEEETVSTYYLCSPCTEVVRSLLELGRYWTRGTARADLHCPVQESQEEIEAPMDYPSY